MDYCKNYKSSTRFCDPYGPDICKFVWNSPIRTVAGWEEWRERGFSNEPLLPRIDRIWRAVDKIVGRRRLQIRRFASSHSTSDGPQSFAFSKY